MSRIELRTAVRISIRYILSSADMKILLWIILFKLSTVNGSYPQINARCTETDEWPSEPDEHPSALAALEVSLADMHGEHSAVTLNISWAINIDSSNKYLRGTRFTVDDKEFLCQYHPPFDEVKTAGFEQLWFHYTEIPALPNKWYTVEGSNLPTPMVGDDIAPQSELYYVPGCGDEIMRQHESCSHKVKEYEWEPNIASIFINGQVEVSFTSSKYATEYDLQLWRCASLKECNDSVIIISEDKCFTEGKSKWTKTLSATGPCDSLHIWILPYFPNCGQLCDGRIAPVDCGLPKEPPNWTFLLCLTSSMMVLVSVAVLIWYKAYKNYSESGGKSQAAPLVSVLVVYPAGNRAFQRAVVAFAEFLQSQWRCRVSIDVWEQGRIAEQGPVRWLTTHTERADNVVIVCARRTESWESAAGHHQLAALRDHVVPASTEDVFSLALNMLEGQVQGLTALGKYCTVHLGDRPEAKCLPAALRVCKSFSLMKDVEKLGRHLHNSGPEPCCFPSVELKPGSLNGDATGRLADAIQELQTVEHL